MKQELKKQARQFRREGKSYNQISRELNVSKSTLSVWLRDIQLTRKQKSLLPKGDTMLGGMRYKQLWEERREAIRQSYVPPMNDAQFALGLALYWGEGTKCNNSTVEITNSDPHILKFFIHWVSKYYGPQKFSARVQHHKPDQDAEVVQHWADLLGLPLQCFGKSGILSPSQSRKRICEGIVRVRVVGGSWEIRQKIEKSVEIAKEHIDNNYDIT